MQSPRFSWSSFRGEIPRGMNRRVVNPSNLPVARAAHTPGPVFRAAFLPEVRP